MNPKDFPMPRTLPEITAEQRQVIGMILYSQMIWSANSTTSGRMTLDEFNIIARITEVSLTILGIDPADILTAEKNSETEEECLLFVSPKEGQA